MKTTRGARTPACRVETRLDAFPVAHHSRPDLRLAGASLPSLAIAFALLLTACQPTAKAGAEIGAKTPTPVHAVPVHLFTPQSGEKYSASLSATKQLTLSFRVAGFVESIHGGDAHRLETGDLVPAGTILAVLRPKDYDIQILQARAQLDAAHRNVEVARQQVA